LLDCSINMNWIAKEMFWNEGFPTIDNMNKYTDNLGNLLIDEIGVSSGNKKYREDLKLYTEKKFKHDIKIKKV